MDVGLATLTRLFAAFGLAICCVAAGCSRDGRQGGSNRHQDREPARIPEGLGTVERRDAPADVAEARHEPQFAERPPSSQVIQKAEALAGHTTGIAIAYSPDGEKALVYPGFTATEHTGLHLVTEDTCEEHEAQLLANARLQALWSPDSARVVVHTYGDARPEGFAFASLLLAGNGEAALHQGQGPRENSTWFVGPFSTDSRVLFAASRRENSGDRGQIWTIDTNTGACSLLFTQPPVRLPAGYESCPYEKPPHWENLLPSPSGQLLLFQGYPGDSYISEALWVVSLRTGQAHQVTWERRPVYTHIPIEWPTDDHCIVFARPLRERPTEFFTLILAPDLWEEKGQRRTD